MNCSRNSQPSGSGRGAEPLGQDRPQYLSHSYLLSPFLDQALWAQTQGSLSLALQKVP